MDGTCILEAVMAYPMDAVVARYAEEEGLPLEVAREHEVELKRFLALCCLNRGASYGMRGPVDGLWHTFIIHTQQYEEFCRSFSNGFIHHRPERGGGTDSREAYTRLLSDYERTFGLSAPAHLWPRFSAESDGSGVSCSECNGCSSGGDPPSERSLYMEQVAHAEGVRHRATIEGVECSGCGGCSAPD